ncbi:hypothetical protein RGQ29_020967 [Quercus rubra]|uniref:Uncharacterized protein n=1 Tax=Quercus rubra TaxID=3512 RepID=A0AAN7FC08_QUERU|nr:hypothetical protein RGQ29_020967 [Quercus rubra]
MSRGKPSLDELTTCAAIIFGMASLKKSVSQIRPRMHHCDIVHQLHFECMIGVTDSDYVGARYCDTLFKQNEKCRDYKSRWKENIQKEATAKGFASAQEYFKHKESQDPRKCRSRYSLYKECTSKGYESRVCDVYRNDCRQFKVS